MGIDFFAVLTISKCSSKRPVVPEIKGILCSIQYLIQAMKIVQAQLPEAELIIAGDGKYQQKLVISSADFRNITFLGAQNRTQVKALMSSAWVTCLPSIKMDRGNEEVRFKVKDDDGDAERPGIHESYLSINTCLLYTSPSPRD